MAHLLHQPFDFFDWFFIIFLIFMALIRWPFIIANFQAQIEHKVTRRFRSVKETFIAFLFGTGTMALPIINIISPDLDHYNFFLPAWVRILAAFGLIIALVIIAKSHFDLGRQWSGVLEIKKDHQLITTGIYKNIRHPMYLGFFFWALFVGLLLPNWLVFAGGLVSYAILYFFRIPEEEELMIKQFGQEYREYQKRTGKIFPRWFS